MTKPAEKTGTQQRRDPDMINAGIALKRAARKVWEEARKTGLPVVYMKDGKIIHSLDGDLDHAED